MFWKNELNTIACIFLFKSAFLLQQILCQYLLDKAKVNYNYFFFSSQSYHDIFHCKVFFHKYYLLLCQNKQTTIKIYNVDVETFFAILNTDVF